MARTPKPSYPAVTVDVCLFAINGDQSQLLLVQRKYAPHKGSLALPGGFLDPKEEIEAAARRELMEETGLEAGTLLEIGAFGKVGRDPRGRTVSIVFAGLLLGEAPDPEAGSDASSCKWVSAARPGKLAFDHKDVVKTTVANLRDRIETRGHLGDLLPKKFTMAALRDVHVAFTGEDIDADAFAARMRRDQTIQQAGKLDGRSALYKYVKPKSRR